MQAAVVRWWLGNCAEGRCGTPGVRTTFEADNYRIPSFADVPDTEVFFADTTDSLEPLGAKGMSDGPINPVAPALGNALADATGIRFTSLPFRTDRNYNALMAMKAAMEKAGKVDREAMINALQGLTIETPTGPLTVGKNHHSTMNLFLAKTVGSKLVTVRPLGEIAPQPGCK